MVVLSLQFSRVVFLEPRRLEKEQIANLAAVVVNHSRIFRNRFIFIKASKDDGSSLEEAQQNMQDMKTVGANVLKVM